MQMLMGGDPSQMLTQMPQLMLQAKKMKEARMLEERKLAMDQAQLEQNERRIRIEKAASDREEKKLGDAERFGRAMGVYDLDTTPRYDGDPRRRFVKNGKTSTLETTLKSDRAMPSGEEGNPYSKRIMSLPLSVRRGMADAPLSAGTFMQKATEEAAQEVFDTNSEARVPKPYTLISPDGKDRWEGDLNNPEDYTEFQTLTEDGWSKAPEQQRVTQDAPKLPQFEEDLDKQIALDLKDAQATDEKARRMEEFAGYAADKSIYVGPFGGMVGSLAKVGQSAFGMFPDVDVSKITQIEKMANEFVQLDRQTAAKDSSMSNADREFWINSEPTINDPYTGIIRLSARQSGLAAYKKERAQFIARARREGMAPSLAYETWENEHAPEARERHMGAEAIGKRMLKFPKSKATLQEYVTRHKGSVKDKLTETMNGESNAEAGGRVKIINGKKHMQVDGEWYEVIE